MGDASPIRTNLAQRDSFAGRFQRDGAMIIEGAFDAEAMALIERAYEGNLQNPGPLAQRLYPDSGGTFIQSVEDSSRKPAFQAMFAGTSIPGMAASIFGSGGVWYFEDQLFFKEGDARPVRRTPWHQDTPYHPIDGSKIVVFWIPLHDIPEDCALEVIPGSHRKTLFNASYFDAEDDTLPVYSEEEMPRLPDIEADRDKWNIMTCAMKRGDVLVFHTSTLHGGGATPPGGLRRSLSLRMVGDDVVRVTRPTFDTGSPAANNVGEDEAQLQSRLTRVPVGDPIHACGLTLILPADGRVS